MRELVVALRRADDAATRTRALAWYIAALSRRDKLMPLEEWLTPRRPGRQTRAQQRAVFEQLSARLGIPLRRVRLVTRERGSDAG
jgi:hypothetical protein